MKAWGRSIRHWVERRLTLRLRLALWSAALLLGVSLALVVFINSIAQMAVPRAVVVPLLASPPSPHPAGSGQLTPVPFEAPVVAPGVVVKGITVHQVQRATLRQVLLISVVGVVLMIGLGSVGAYWQAGQALRPVRELSRAVSQIDVGALDKRLAFQGPDDEIKVLAEAFDALLDRLERAFDQQSRFASDAAHELRTPLATLRTNLEIIQANPEAMPDDYVQMSATLERTLTRLEHLVANLLLLTRDEQHLAREALFLWPLLEEVLLEMKPLADVHSVGLRLDGQTEVVVNGDGPLLASAFGNLIENGIYYNHPGGAVTVTLGQEGRWAVVTVADSGIGISEEEQAHIFDRFYRADHSRSRYRDGAGLGLSLVAHIVQLHGGEVQVESTPGVGSTFTIRLPM